MTIAPEDLVRLDADRTAALDESALGRRFRIYQPRNLAFWVWSILTVIGLIALIGELGGKASYYGVAIGVSVVLFVLYGVGLWWFTRSVDRYSPLPGTLAFVAFTWGGLVAPWLMARAANDALGSLYAKLLGAQWAHYWVPAASVWFSEEFAKGAAIVLLIALAPKILRTAFDGFIAGAYAGLGFQVVENIIYGQRSPDSGFAVEQFSAAFNLALMRMASGIGSHIWFTAVFGAGLVYLVGRPNEPRRAVRGVLLMVSSMVVHFVWDSQSSIAALSGNTMVSGLLTMFFFVGLPVISAGIAFGVYRLSVVNERSLLPPILAPEVARGVITEAELIAASGSAKDRRRYLAAGGSKRRRRAVLHGVVDLTSEIGRSAGADSDRLDFVRGEVRRAREAIGA